jgi:hypothetical protein
MGVEAPSGVEEAWVGWAGVERGRVRKVRRRVAAIKIALRIGFAPETSTTGRISRRLLLCAHES